MKIEMLRNGICWTYIQWIGSDKSAKQIHEAVKAVFKDSRVYVEVGGTLILIHYPLTVAQKDSVEEVAPSNAVRVEIGDWVVIDDGLYSEQKAISFLKNEEVLDGLRENSNSLRAKQVRRYISSGVECDAIYWDGMFSSFATFAAYRPDVHNWSISGSLLFVESNGLKLSIPPNNWVICTKLDTVLYASPEVFSLLFSPVG